jgi:hypothetical protein
VLLGGDFAGISFAELVQQKRQKCLKNERRMSRGQYERHKRRRATWESHAKWGASLTVEVMKVR